MASLVPDKRNRPSTAQTGNPGDSALNQREPEQPKTQDGTVDWVSRAQSAYQASTSYVDSNYRKVWEDSIRAFNNQHPSDSKYVQQAYEKRSRVYRPKTRAVIRKNEAAGAAAFFSNTDIVSFEPQDKTSKVEAANSDIMKELVTYRLKKSIPWFMIVMGGLQDAQNVGAVCAHIHWEYEEENPQETLDAEQPKPKIKKDKPCIELLPVENLRIDPGASWLDPINTSPYLIHLIPMYVCDVKEKMASGMWKTYDDAVISNATELRPDTTRSARNKDRDDPVGSDVNTVDDYTVVWIQKHIHRYEGEDVEFYVLGDDKLLTDPVPLKEVMFHGLRPYVMGCGILETHKIYPSSVPQLSRGLQEETNEIANQRLDNVKFVLNKKYLVKRGKEADLYGLVRNVPGGMVLVDDPEGDVKELNWPDITASAFQEQDGIGREMDELLGNFNPASLMVQGAANSPARNMAMLNQSNGTLVEYMLTTYKETFVLPVLRQLVQLEQHYETDEVILKIAGKNAKLVEKYGIDNATDALLEGELTLTMDVGMGATDPMRKLQKLLTAMGAYTGMLQKPTPGVNMVEFGKEVFGCLGYGDGSRFFTVDDPQVLMLQQQLQKAQQIIGQLQMKVQDKQTGHMVKLKTNTDNNKTKVATTLIHESNENKRALATHWRGLHDKSLDHHAKMNPPQPPEAKAA